MSNLNAVYEINLSDKKLILDTISKLKKKRFSYQKIGEKLNLNKSAVYHLEHGNWFPKTSEVIDRILAGIRELGYG